MAEHDQDSGRDERGRFAPGNAGGSGGTRKRAFALRRAAEEAITPEHVEAMIRKATRMGLEGDLAAMRLVLDRTCGKAAESPKEADPVPVDLPELRTAADCNEAVGRLLDGIVRGALDREVAKVLLDAVQARLKAIELTEVEERLVDLEKATQHTVLRRL